MEEVQQLLEKAAKICLSVHSQQRDKAGKAYFQHPFRVAMNCDTDEEKIVALLHDVVEDGDIDEDFLRQQEFPENIIEAIMKVTRRDSESYEDFIKKLAPCLLARRVKIKDLEDNLNILRINQLNEYDLERCNKYLNALNYLKDFKEITNKSASISRLKKTSPCLPFSGERTESIFYIDGNEWKGIGQLTTDRKIIILKDSILRLGMTKSYSGQKLRNQIIEQYCVMEENGYRVLSDIQPLSPSTSSGLILGRSSNGNVEWRDVSGVPLGTYLNTL